MLDLNDLRLFATVARLRSVSAAALELGMPKSSVSRNIVRLEEALGTRLLHRSSRDMELTHAGEVFLRQCDGALDQIDAAVEQVSTMTGQHRGRLKIGCVVAYGINVLSELLPKFLDKYPQIDIVLELRSAFPDLISEGFDVALLIGSMPDSNLIASRIGVFSRILCASPTYLSRYGRPSTPRDLHTHKIVEMRKAHDRPHVWTFEREGRLELVNVAPRVFVNELLAIHKLVQRGVGIGILTDYMCNPLLENGSVVHILPEWSIPAVDVSLVFPSRKTLSPMVRAFVDFMRAEAAQLPAASNATL